MIIERDALARIGVRHALKASSVVAVEDAVATIRDATYLPSRTPVDVALVGSTVSDLDDLDGIGRLMVRFVRARVVLFCDAPSPAWVVAPLRAGADGVLSRTITPAALIRAIGGVVRGDTALSRTDTAAVVVALRERTHNRSADMLLQRLSPRERDVLAEFTAGRSNAEIGVRLGLKESTVKSHVSSILLKSGARSRHALCPRAVSVWATA